jgi:predicted nucleotidyltransferase
MAEVQPSHDAGLNDLLGKIVSRADPVQVWLFGSRARGDHQADSDYDILIVVDDDWPAGKANAREGYRLVEGRSIPVDVLMARRTQFMRDRNIVGTLARTVWHDGRLLYDRATTAALA